MLGSVASKADSERKVHHDQRDAQDHTNFVQEEAGSVLLVLKQECSLHAALELKRDIDCPDCDDDDE